MTYAVFVQLQGQCLPLQILLVLWCIEGGRNRGLNGCAETATETHRSVEVGVCDGVACELHEVLEGRDVVGHGPRALVVAHALQFRQSPGSLVDRAEPLDERIDEVEPRTKNRAMVPLDLSHQCLPPFSCPVRLHIR